MSKPRAVRPWAFCFDTSPFRIGLDVSYASAATRPRTRTVRMIRLTVGFVLAVPLLALAGPDSQRSFPDANCAFSLPGPDWEWLDPKKAPSSGTAALAFARNRAGV